MVSVHLDKKINIVVIITVIYKAVKKFMASWVRIRMPTFLSVKIDNGEFPKDSVYLN